MQREVFADSDRRRHRDLHRASRSRPNGNLYAASVADRTDRRVRPRRELRAAGRRAPGATAAGFPTPTGNAARASPSAPTARSTTPTSISRARFPNVGPGPTTARSAASASTSDGDPLPPEIVRDGLAFPDGVAVFPGDLERKKRRSGGPSGAVRGGRSRQFLNAGGDDAHARTTLASCASAGASTRGAIVTASPTVAARRRCRTRAHPQIVYFQSWDDNVYAVRLADGSKLWRFTTDLQPGAPFPAAASAHVERVGDRDLVFVGSARRCTRSTRSPARRSGASPPAPAARRARRSAGTLRLRRRAQRDRVLADRRRRQASFFGMDVNDVALGKGGFYGSTPPTAAWRGSSTSRAARPAVPDAGRRRSAASTATTPRRSSGLPAGFFATRAGLRLRPRADRLRERVVVARRRRRARPPLLRLEQLRHRRRRRHERARRRPCRRYDEALVALHFDGTPAWRWRPREVDNDDLAFGATPNLFSIERGEGVPRRRRRSAARTAATTCSTATA